MRAPLRAMRLGAALACAPRLAASARVAEESQFESDGATVPSSLVDVTDWIREPDAAHRLRCCCDQPKLEAIHWHSPSDHSGRCSVDFREGGHCADFGRDGRQWQLGHMHHYTATGGRCRIDWQEVDIVLRAIGTGNAEFCSRVDADSASGIASVPAARLDELVPVNCALGFQASSPQVRCSFSLDGVSLYEPEPRCNRVFDYCAEVQDGPASVRAAALGDVREVACAHATLEARQVTCGDDGAFAPAPRCPPPPEDATRRAALIESQGLGRCCCNMEASGLLSWFGDEESHHTGACQIHEGISHCREVSGEARVIHYTRSAERKCVIYS